jgi:CBS domain-containing protein
VDREDRLSVEESAPSAARTVADAMGPPPPALRDTDPVADALARMDELSVVSLPVANEKDQWVGLALWNDLDRARETPGRAVRELAKAELALSPDDTIESALERLQALRVGRLPVVSKGAVVGSFSQRDAREPAGRLRVAPIARWMPPVWTWGARRQPEPPIRPERLRPGNRPAIDYALEKQIDAAIELLAAVPFEELQARGWHFQPNHYYWPLNDIAFLRANPDLWHRMRVPTGIHWDLDAQERLLREVTAYLDELGDVRDRPPAAPGEFVWGNDSLPRGDAAVYYGLLRHLAPERVVEVGAGWSSRVLARAEQAKRKRIDVTLIEPEPNEELLQGLPDHWLLRRDLLQRVEGELWETLAPGDVLFYDGSHCVRTGSDVNWFFFEVLPRLQPGVWVHLHDIYWPHDYPVEWTLDEGLSWNEQYLLQAFLMHNADYQVRLAMGMLLTDRPGLMLELLPDHPGGVSVWIEKLRA